MNLVSDQHTTRLKRNKCKLIKCLDVDNGLADQLYSEDVLTDKECKGLSDCEAYLKQNDIFCEMFIIKLKEDENLYRNFHEALLDTDQKHVDNLLEGMVVYNL